MAPNNTDDTAGLAAKLASADADERAEAAEKLAQAGTEAAAAAIPLVRACGDADERVREWSVAALEESGPPPPEAIATLATLAQEGVPLAAYWAVTLLGRAGQAAGSTAGVLAGCLALVLGSATPLLADIFNHAIREVRLDGCAVAGSPQVVNQVRFQLVAGHGLLP